MAYRIEIAPAAERQIRGASGRRIFKIIDTLGRNPRPASVEKLTDAGVSVLAPIESSTTAPPVQEKFADALFGRDPAAN